MEELTKKIEQIFDRFFLDEQNNRLNQWAFSAFKNVIMGEIRNYKLKSNQEEKKK